MRAACPSSRTGPSPQNIPDCHSTLCSPLPNLLVFVCELIIEKEWSFSEKVNLLIRYKMRILWINNNNLIHRFVSSVTQISLNLSPMTRAFIFIYRDSHPEADLCWWSLYDPSWLTFTGMCRTDADEMREVYNLRNKKSDPDNETSRSPNYKKHAFLSSPR